MPQTSYAQYHDAAIAGQVVEGIESRGQRGRYECSENLNFGRLVELHTDGKLREPQGTTTSMKIVGGVAYNPSLPPGGYLAGSFMVPAFRRGQMWVPYTGTTPTVEATFNIRHASDDSNSEAQHRGKVTATATSTTAGSEIQAAPAGMACIKVNTTLGLALIEFNLP